MINKCIACGEVANEGFAIGQLCYYCIEEAVTHIIKEKKMRNNSTLVDLKT
jgi:hypothetical protein